MARLDALVEAAASGTWVALDGSGSWDASGRKVAYRWRVEGPRGPVELTDPSSPRPRARTQGPGAYHAWLTVDAGGEVSTATRLDFALEAGPDTKVPPRLLARPSSPASAVATEFVQLYIGQTPLSPAPARLSADGTALLASVTLSSATTNGTVLSLEKVLENGQFFFPHQVVRTYTVRLSATASRQLVLGDPGTLFVNPEVLGQPQNILVALGNNVPAFPTGPQGSACSLGGRWGAADGAAFLVALLPVFLRRRRRAGVPPTFAFAART
ncbi:MAG: hypothetical protein HYY25_16830 [Candidatus Wallbacteria bacterium]|nr:hypothetical protein [Candidatus Wallbacteria bacterium]